MLVATGPRVRFVRVRQGGSERRFALLDERTRERYLELVARSASRIESLLSPAVMANRVASWRVDPPELRLRPWRMERRLFAARLASLATRRSAIVFADVRRCYASISPSTVGQTLRLAGIGTADELEDLLASLAEVGVPGLPVGPDPSAVLANLVLARVDRELREAGVEHLRWVDDVVLPGGDPRASLAVLARALASVGLALNERKTRVVVDPSALRGDASISGCRARATRRRGRVG